MTSETWGLRGGFGAHTPSHLLSFSSFFELLSRPARATRAHARALPRRGFGDWVSPRGVAFGYGPMIARDD